MYYRIRHATRFTYSGPVTESLMELRMHPRTEGPQRCLDFQLNVLPKAQVFLYKDHLGNQVHHFDVPAAHRQLMITAESLVEMRPFPEVPHFLAPDAWDELDHAVENGDYWVELLPSPFCSKTERLQKLIDEIGAVRRDDPLALIREINRKLYEAIEYEPEVTHVDSPIDDALAHRKGVCQDYSHIMIAILRNLRIPARYVSGYLHHRKQDHDRSSDGATHAWVEAFLPSLGWLGLDPTNDLIAAERHIRTAIGRDYSDVPPTRGVLKGAAQSKLRVSVGVAACEELPPELAELVMQRDEVFEKQMKDEAEAIALLQEQMLQQQQQQQQQ